MGRNFVFVMALAAFVHAGIALLAYEQGAEEWLLIGEMWLMVLLLLVAMSELVPREVR